MADAQEPMPSREIPGECPSALDIGSAGWTILHTSAVSHPYAPSATQQEAMRSFIYAWSQVYACSWCAFHMRQYVAAHPPVVTDKNSITRYVCELHNEVNVRLGKDVYDCDPAVQLKRWHPGYPDHLADEPTIEVKLAQAALAEKEKSRERRRLEEAERQRIAALGLARPEKRSTVGWRAWGSGSAEDKKTTETAARESPASPSDHERPAASAPSEMDQSASQSDWRLTGSAGGPREAAGPHDTSNAAEAGAEMSPSMMASLLSRIKGCKVFCPEDAK